MPIFTQLNPPIPLFVVGKGNGLAHGVIDYGPEYDLLWVIVMDAGGEIWCLKNTKVRGQINLTMERSSCVDESQNRQH
jgi:hypothetical protein